MCRDFKVLVMFYTGGPLVTYGQEAAEQGHATGADGVEPTGVAAADRNVVAQCLPGTAGEAGGACVIEQQPQQQQQQLQTPARAHAAAAATGGGGRKGGAAPNSSGVGGSVRAAAAAAPPATQDACAGGSGGDPVGKPSPLLKQLRQIHWSLGNARICSHSSSSSSSSSGSAGDSEDECDRQHCLNRAGDGGGGGNGGACGGDAVGNGAKPVADRTNSSIRERRELGCNVSTPRNNGSLGRKAEAEGKSSLAGDSREKQGDDNRGSEFMLSSSDSDSSDYDGGYEGDCSDSLDSDYESDEDTEEASTASGFEDWEAAEELPDEDLFEDTGPAFSSSDTSSSESGDDDVGSNEESVDEEEPDDIEVLRVLARAIARTRAGRVLSFHSRAKAGAGCVNAFATPSNRLVLQRLLLEEFGASWVKRVTLRGLTADDTGRRAVLDEFDATPDDEVYVLASCRTIGEGVDTKHANMVFFATPRGSHSATVQVGG